MSREKLALRVGGGFLVVGCLVAAIARFNHGDLPAADAEGSLKFIAVHPQYVYVHLSAVLGALTATLGYFLVSNTFRRPLAWVFGRMGAAAVVVGMAVYTVDFSIDGEAGTLLASQYATASPAVRADLVHEADVAFTALYGISLTGIAVLWGVTLVMFGLALAADRRPGYLAWPGVLIGAVTVIGAITEYLFANVYPGVWLYGGLVSLALLWGVAFGVWSISSRAVSIAVPAEETA